jgi:hypothetical protein
MTLFALFCFTANLFSLLNLSKVIVELWAIAYKHVMTLFALFCFTANLFSILNSSKVIMELWQW